MLAIEFEQLSALGLTPALANRAAAHGSRRRRRRMKCCASPRSTAARSACTTVARSAARARCRGSCARCSEDGTALAVGDWVLATSDGLRRNVDRSARAAVVAHRAARRRRLRSSGRQQRRHRAPGDGPRRRLQSAAARALSRARPRRRHRPRRRADQGRRRHADARGTGEAPGAARRTRSPRRRGLRGECAGRLRRTARCKAIWGAVRRWCCWALRERANRRSPTRCSASQVQDTGAVRENDGRGKHTTTSRSLHRLPGGACVIDTPGLRTLASGYRRSVACRRVRRHRGSGSAMPLSRLPTRAGARVRGARGHRRRTGCATTTSCCARCAATR